MDNHSWIYRELSDGLYKQCFFLNAFLKKILLEMVEDFINFILSNLKNINDGKIRCSCVKCKNKKFHHKDVVTMHLFKKRFSRNT
jgi:hypothetical protein